MKCVILVAGYAKRLYPISLNKPKSLLKVNNRTVLDMIVDNLEDSCDYISEYFLVTNNTFYSEFLDWKSSSKIKDKINIVNNGCDLPEENPGAVNNLITAIRKNNINEDIFVLAGDNILDFSFKYIFDEFINNDNSCIMYYIESDEKKLKNTGVIELNDEDFVVSMEEKPKNPKSNKAVPPFYWLKYKDVKKILNINKKIENLGEIVVYLYQISKIKAMLMNGNRYKIDTEEDYFKLLEKLK